MDNQQPRLTRSTAAEMLHALRSERTVGGEDPSRPGSRLTLADVERLRADGFLRAGSHGLPRELCQLLLVSFDPSSDREYELGWLANELPGASVYRMAGAFGFDALACGQIDKTWVKDQISKNNSGIPSFAYYHRLHRLFRYKGYPLDGLRSTPVGARYFRRDSDVTDFLAETRDHPDGRQWLHDGQRIGAYTFLVLLRSRIDIRSAEQWLSSLSRRYPQLMPFVHDAFYAMPTQPNDNRIRSMGKRAVQVPSLVYRDANYVLRVQLLAVDEAELSSPSPFAQADRVREFLEIGAEHDVIAEHEVLFLESFKESHEQVDGLAGRSGGLFIGTFPGDEGWMRAVRSRLSPLVRPDLHRVWTAPVGLSSEVWQSRLTEALTTSRYAVLLIGSATEPPGGPQQVRFAIQQARSLGLRVGWVSTGPIDANSLGLEVTDALEPNLDGNGIAGTDPELSLDRLCDEIAQRYRADTAS